MYNMVECYNQCIKKGEVDYAEDKIAWSSSLLSFFERKETAVFEADKIREAMYRPFVKQYVYYGDKMIHRRGQFDMFFPTMDSQNLLICVSGIGVTKDFTCLISRQYVDLEFVGKSQCFPLYFYEFNPAKAQISMFDEENPKDKYIRRDGISDWALKRARQQYGKGVVKRDIFFYVYGLLHSPEYRKIFANDLKKSLPRIPFVDNVKDFWTFSKAGRLLADLHLNYESVEPYSGVVVEVTHKDYRVEKMRFPAKDQKDTIIYNEFITIKNIPDKAYRYVVNGKSAIEWVMERYAVTQDKASGIINDPNDWAKESGKPSYILDLLLSIINVSIQTVDIIESLPKLDFAAES